jgi:hypothetical protein
MPINIIKTTNLTNLTNKDCPQCATRFCRPHGFHEALIRVISDICVRFLSTITSVLSVLSVVPYKCFTCYVFRVLIRGIRVIRGSLFPMPLAIPRFRPRKQYSCYLCYSCSKNKLLCILCVLCSYFCSQRHSCH